MSDDDARYLDRIRTDRRPPLIRRIQAPVQGMADAGTTESHLGSGGTDGDRTSTVTYPEWYPIPPILPLPSKCVLPDASVSELRAAYESGMSLREMARKYEVSHETVRQLLKSA